jgi:hypothetical protein
MSNRPLLAAAYLALLAGCSQAQVPPIDYSATNSQRAAQDAGLETCQRERDSPKFAALRSRLASDEHGSTVEQFADARRPTPTERRLILDWANLAERCRPFLQTSFVVSGVPWEQFQMTIAALASGEISYAEYHRHMTELTMAAAGVARSDQLSRLAIMQSQEDAAAAALANGVSDAITASILNSRRHR